MITFRIVLARVLALFRKRWSDVALLDEIRVHLDLLADDFVKRGMTPEAARAAARREFGGIDQMKERYRDQRSLPMLDALRTDLRYAFRLARTNPGFAAVA